MLRQIVIENLALIKKAELDLSPKFTVITGESGAGKSLFVKAIKLILGIRAHSSLVGNHTNKATVQALFDSCSFIEDFFSSRDIDFDGEVIIRRILSSDGKGRIYINGVLSNLNDLKTLTSNLVNIASQHEFHTIVQKEQQRNILDLYANIDISSLETLYVDTLETRKVLEGLLKKKKESKEKKRQLSDDAKRIDDLNLQEDEEDQLIEEKKILRSSKKLRDLASELYSLLYQDKSNIVELLSKCRSIGDRISALDSRFELISDRLSSLFIEADDIATSVQDYLFNLPLDDKRLSEVEERLYQIREIKRLFGPDIKDVISYRKRIDEELTELEGLEKEIEKVSKLLEKKEKELIELSIKVSNKRKEAAKELSLAVEKELSDLNLEKSRFLVSVEAPDNPSAKDVKAYGIDDVTFLFCANPGGDLEPISLVASGGELSRILLAIKVILGKKSRNEVVVFDEIDTGLGGETAERVGKKLKEISKYCQVIAITHFPQIAAMGDVHVRVVKKHSIEQTESCLEVLNEQQRLDEIVRMLGGDRDSARRYAKEMLSSFFRGTR